MQDIPSMLERKEIEPGCYFDPDAPGTREHFVRVNYEGYFFADAAQKERFEEAPTQYCGFVTDPVTKRRFLPELDAPSIRHEGTLFLFEDENSATAFRADPGSYQLPGWKMESADEEAEAPADAG